ncbi:hypothetical protein EDC51_11115 [Bibersteinia trehalosi]|nr:hypothetical protein EDC51_11115 [Bibersteinia trehalosi]
MLNCQDYTQELSEIRFYLEQAEQHAEKGEKSLMLHCLNLIKLTVGSTEKNAELTEMGIITGGENE